MRTIATFSRCARRSRSGKDIQVLAERVGGRGIHSLMMAFAPRGVSWLGITTGEASPRDFTLEIDDVELIAELLPDEPLVQNAQKVEPGDPRSLDRLAFTTIARDERGDTVSPRLPDARELQLAVDPTDGRVWFRFVLQDPPPAGWFGLNVALDVDGDTSNGGAWWGQNKRFHFDRLITVYLSRGAGYWQGIAGVADAAQIARFSASGLSTDVRVVVDPARRTAARSETGFVVTVDVPQVEAA